MNFAPKRQRQQGASSPPSSPVRVAVIGLGVWGRLAHLPSLARHPDVTIVAVADLDDDLTQTVARKYRVPWAVSSPEELWSRANMIDALVVATPTDTHEDVVMTAAGHGKHVLCEKPLGFTMNQAQAMFAATDAAAVVARMGFVFRFSPAVQRMKALVTAGSIGRLVAFQSQTMNAQFVDPRTPLHWKMLLERAGGGVSVEYGIHAIDLALWLGGPIAEVVARGTTIVDRRPDSIGTLTDVRTEDAASWLATYASGAQAVFDTSWSTLPIGGGGIRLYGTQGSLAWQPDISLRLSETLVGATMDHPTPTILERYETSQPDGLGISSDYNDRLVASFIHDVRTGERTGPTFDDGMRAQSVLEAIRKSMRSRQWEAV